MFTIGKVYHVVHVVSDLDAADAWYDAIFAPCRYYRGYMAEAFRDASLLAIGDFVMEPVAMAKVPGAEDSAIGRFYRRFGQRFHSVAWFVDSVEKAFETLNEHNIRMYSAGGEYLQEARAGRAVFTHPKDTYGTLEFARYGGLRPDQDPRLQPTWSTTFWRDEHPLGIERADHMTTLVQDLGRAKAFYLQVLGGRLLHEEEIPQRKRSAYFALGDETVMEVAEPITADSLEGREIEMSGEAIYGVTFKVKDLGKAAAFLAEKGVRTAADGVETIVVDREQAMGGVISFTQRRLPNDERN